MKNKNLCIEEKEWKTGVLEYLNKGGKILSLKMLDHIRSCGICLKQVQKMKGLIWKEGNKQKRQRFLMLLHELEFREGVCCEEISDLFWDKKTMGTKKEFEKRTRLIQEKAMELVEEDLKRNKDMIPEQISKESTSSIEEKNAEIKEEIDWDDIFSEQEEVVLRNAEIPEGIPASLLENITFDRSQIESIFNLLMKCKDIHFSLEKSTWESLLATIYFLCLEGKKCKEISVNILHCILHGLFEIEWIKDSFGMYHLQMKGRLSWPANFSNIYQMICKHSSLRIKKANFKKAWSSFCNGGIFIETKKGSYAFVPPQGIKIL